MSGPVYHQLCDALAQAVRDIRPVAAALDTEALAVELDRRISAYWGPGHGISWTELANTARDVQASVRRADSATETAPGRVS